jgi:hypothetical protein
MLHCRQPAGPWLATSNPPMRQVALGAAIALGLAANVAGHPRQVASMSPPSWPVTWLVLVDDLHLDFRRTGESRKVLTAALDALVLSGDRIVVRSTGPSTLALDLSLVDPPFDRDRLSAAVVKRTTGNALKPEDMTTPRARREVRCRARVTLDALRQLVDAALPIDGATAMLYVSNGYSVGAMDLSAVVEQAGRAGAPLYPLDPRPHGREQKDPFVRATRDILRELANATGGTWQDDGETLVDYLARLRAGVGR